MHAHTYKCASMCKQKIKYLAMKVINRYNKQTEIQRLYIHTFTKVEKKWRHKN